MDLDTWRTVAITIAAVGQTAFVVLYLTFPWWKRFLGRVLFGKAVSLLIIVDTIALSRYFDFGTSDALFAALYSILALGIWAQFGAFVWVKMHSKGLGYTDRLP